MTSRIDAGEVVDLGIVSEDFEIVGDQAFAVASFQVGAELIDPGVPFDQQKGDPAMSLVTSTEQYRTRYVFLGPSDDDVGFIDVVQPTSATLTLDGATPAAEVVPLSSGYGLARIQLGPGNGGAHVLTATEPVGLQVRGYGSYTSYQYPGGLNLSEDHHRSAQVTRLAAGQPSARGRTRRRTWARWSHCRGAASPGRGTAGTLETVGMGGAEAAAEAEAAGACRVAMFFRASSCMSASICLSPGPGLMARSAW